MDPGRLNVTVILLKKYNSFTEKKQDIANA